MRNAAGWTRLVPVVLAAALGGAASGRAEGLLSGLGSIAWGQGDPEQLAVRQVPEAGTLVRVWRELEVRDRDGKATLLAPGAFVRVGEIKGGRIPVVRREKLGDLSGWVTVADMPMRGDEPIEIDGMRLHAQRLEGAQPPVAAQWDDRFDWNGIAPAFTRLYAGERPVDGGRLAVRALFCDGGLAMVERSHRFEGSPAQQDESARRVLDALQSSLGEPRCRILNRTSVVCSWESDAGIAHLRVQGTLREAPPSDFPEGPRRSDLTGSLLWSIQNVVDLGPHIEAAGGEVLAAPQGRFLLVRYTLVNAGDAPRPFVYGGGIPHPTLIGSGGSALPPVGASSQPVHEAFVAAHADVSANRILSHLVMPLAPGQSISFSAIYEVPSSVQEISFAVAESTAAGSARARIPLGEVEPPAPLAAARRCDVWEVVDRDGRIGLGTSCAMSAEFPLLRQGLIDRAREVRAVQRELEVP